MKKIAIILLLLMSPAWAQNTQSFKNFIGGLPLIGSPATNDRMYILQGGVNKAISPMAIGGSGGSSIQGTDATSIGVDCSDVADSTTAIQNFVTANPSGRLVFPLACTFHTSSAILLNGTSNFQFAGVPNTFGPPTVVWRWKGSNGGAACALSANSCVFMININDSVYSVVTDIQMKTNAYFGSGGDNCSDGFIRADQDGMGSDTTQGLFQNLWLDNLHQK